MKEDDLGMDPTLFITDDSYSHLEEHPQRRCLANTVDTRTPAKGYSASPLLTDWVLSGSSG